MSFRFLDPLIGHTIEMSEGAPAQLCDVGIRREQIDIWAAAIGLACTYKLAKAVVPPGMVGNAGT